MPELSNIQTFEKLEGINFEPVLSRFSNVLMNIGVWNDEIENSLKDFKWKVEDNGFVYSYYEVEPVTSNFSKIKIRPLVTGRAFGYDSLFKDNWVSCDLLIHTEDLRISNSGYFSSDTFQLVKNLCSEMLKEFKQTGVYFTDEGQDSQDFYGMLENNKSKLWQFDYALIPLSFCHLYSDIPDTHLVNANKEFFEVCRTDVWSEF